MGEVVKTRRKETMMSASKKLRRAAELRRRAADRLADRERSRLNALAADERRRAMRESPAGRAARPGMLPGSLALAAMALAGGFGSVSVQNPVRP